MKRPLTPVHLGLLIGLIAAMGAAPSGCAAPGTHGTMPLGRWTGQGVCVFEQWPDKGKESPEQHPESRLVQYSTELAIRPLRLDGHDVIEVDIVSRHGGLPGLEDPTRVRFAIRPAKRASDSAMLYQVVDLKVNAGSESKLHYDDSGPPYGASCMTIAGVTTFQIAYAEDFIDTFRFAGRKAEKTGMYFDPEKGLIHWVEQLRRTN